jgi:hypothetical protein
MKKLRLLLYFVSTVLACLPMRGQDLNSIHKDSEAIVSWANVCEVNRGFLNISHPELGYVSSGNPENVIGISNGFTLSLGDGGMAVLQFPNPIANGEGADFAVFENAFFSPPNQNELAFCELAFVEVSSDGVNFIRFPAFSEQQTESQIGGFAVYTPCYFMYDLFIIRRCCRWSIAQS